MACCLSCSVPGTVGDMGDPPVKTTPKFLSSGSFHAGGEEGRGGDEGAEKDCKYKSARGLLLTRNAVEKYRAGKGTRGAGGGATAL